MPEQSGWTQDCTMRMCIAAMDRTIAKAIFNTVHVLTTILVWISNFHYKTFGDHEVSSNLEA